jgi:hypothetical protein
MKVATAVLTHAHPELTGDSVAAIQTWVGDRVLVLVDRAGWPQFENARFGAARIEPGFLHAFNRSPYRNSILAVKKLYEYWPDSDWFLWTEYDCLFASDAFKADLAWAESRDVWCAGVDLRRFEFQLPYFEVLLDRGSIRHSYYLLGCCLFLSRCFVAKLHQIGFFDRFLEFTSKFANGFFPGYPRWAFEEELWPTTAVQLGGSLYELACWKSADRQWHQRYEDDPHVLYADGEHPKWRGRFPVYRVRFMPAIGPGELRPEMSIAHPVKELGHPIRVYNRNHREDLARRGKQLGNQ